MSRKRIDLTGDRYGRLIVLKEVEQSGYMRRFLCRCDCGNETIVRMSNLRTGHTTSCGCQQRERTSETNVADLRGKKFGKLTVIGRSGTAKNRKSMWECKCDCGNTTTVSSTDLTGGGTQSCGCHRIKKGDELQKYNVKELTVDDVFVPALQRKVRSDSSTGVKGVSFEKSTGKYRASIGIKGKNIFLGRFSTIEQAKSARKQAEKEYHEPYIKQLEEKENEDK